MKLTVKTERIDDELLLKRMRLTLGSRSIITPFKATDSSVRKTHVIELYREISMKTLDSMVSSETQERRINSDIERQKMGDLTLFIVNYTDLAFPSGKQMEALSDLQYSHSDIVITPAWSKLCREVTGEELPHRYIEATNGFLDIVETLNNKTVIGLISSKIPRQYLDEVMDNYYERGVTSFVLDFDGRSITTNPTWIRNFMRKLSSYGIVEESFIYSVNSNEGKFMKNAERVLAKDFITIGFGVDGLGLNHIPPRMPTSAWKQIRDARKENTYRLFDRTDYAYAKVAENSLVDQWSITPKQVRPAIKTYNMEEQKNETLEIQRRMETDSTIEQYIQTKTQVDEGTIKKIKKTRKDAFEKRSRQTSLFD